MARNNAVYRMLRPRYLCFLREAFNDENRGVDVRSVEEWENSDGQDVNLAYLFVAYSTEHFSHSSQEDMMALHHIAETACRAAKLPAYWIACSCMRDEKELESDVSVAVQYQCLPRLICTGLPHLRCSSWLRQNGHRRRKRQALSTRLLGQNQHRISPPGMGQQNVDFPRSSP